MQDYSSHNAVIIQGQIRDSVDDQTNEQIKYSKEIIVILKEIRDLLRIKELKNVKKG